MQKGELPYAVQSSDEPLQFDALAPEMLEMIAGGEATVNAI